MDNCLEIRNLTKNYNTFTLDHINLELPKGTITGFIGENGAGKTTTIKSILNLIHIDSGQIFYEGNDISDTRVQNKMHEEIGVVLDECCFHETLKVSDINKIMKNIYKNWNDATFTSYITKFKVPKDKLIKEFSKGMKMKLNLAVALSHQPKLLILDEATSGLDPVIRNQILDVFLDFIQDEDHTIFLSSHITTDLEKICDYITFIHDGKIVFSESKDTVMEDYGIVHCRSNEIERIDSSYIINERKSHFNTDILIKDKEHFSRQYPNMLVDCASLEDIMLFYSGGMQS